MLYVVDAFAALIFLIGYHLAFRQKLLGAWRARLRQRGGSEVQNGVSFEDPEGVASVLRMIGVMMMAFSFTAAAFANLIAHYSSVGVN